MLKQTILPLQTTAPIFFGLVLFAVTTLHAVEPGKEILLWPSGAPGSEGKSGEMKANALAAAFWNSRRPSLASLLGELERCTIRT
jgi:hypothetical protein